MELEYFEFDAEKMVKKTKLPLEDEADLEIIAAYERGELKSVENVEEEIAKAQAALPQDICAKMRVSISSFRRGFA